MPKQLLNILFFSLLCILCNAQNTGNAIRKSGVFRIGELNCENLFDTLHDEGFNDHEFLPQGEHQWTTSRYWRKMSMLAREIASMSSVEPIDLVALIEVENDTVLRDLTQRTVLSRLGYRYIVTHGIDPRGIDVALLYQEGTFKPLNIRSIRLGDRISPPLRTRDVLHVNGRARSGDTIDIFVCHMPSKVGGKKSERNRTKIARQLRLCIDSVNAQNPCANIIVTGDFNDSPSSESLTRDLGAILLHPVSGGKRQKYRYKAESRLFTPQFARLYNLSAQPGDKGAPQGTYSYRGDWEILDQCIVNERLLNPKNRLHIARNPYRIVYSQFLLDKDAAYGGFKPMRTFQGTFYRGGFSDHLPIIVEFEY